MRRLRAGLVTPLPGGLGSRSGGIRTAPRGARWTGTGFTSLVPGSADRGTEKPRWSAARRAPFAKGAHAARRELTKDAPRGAPSPRLLPRVRKVAPRKWEEGGLPGAGKEYGRR